MPNLHEQFGQIDIYLFDQILRGRVVPGMRLFDAGCGFGRNLVYFLREGYEVFGVDSDPLSSAVLHFARDDDHFLAMLHGTWRVLKPAGLLFCRVASSIGMEHQMKRIVGRRFLLRVIPILRTQADSEMVSRIFSRICELNGQISEANHLNQEPFYGVRVADNQPSGRNWGS